MGECFHFSSSFSLGESPPGGCFSLGESPPDFARQATSFHLLAQI